MDKQLIKDVYEQAVADQCGCNKFNQDAVRIYNLVLSEIVDNAGQAIRCTTIDFNAFDFSNDCVRYQSVVIRRVADKIRDSVSISDGYNFHFTFCI